MTDISRIWSALFNPQSAVVVGASSHPNKLGNFVLRSVKSSRIKRIYAVHAGGAKEILGVKTFPSIKDLPDDNIDLFLFCIPHVAVIKSLEFAINKGCKGAVIYAGGFKESGKEGIKLQNRLKEISRQAEIGIIGPNTLGYFRSSSFINATFMPVFSEMFAEKGKISIVSQSGGVAGQIAIKFAENHLPLGTLICLGNRANIDFHHALDFLANDENTSAIGLFIEGLDDIQSFYASALKCSRMKPVVVMGAGFSEAGKKAAKSHTGSMATSKAIYDGMFKQAGLLQVENTQELVDTLKALHFEYSLEGKRTALITHTAGPAIIASDVISNGGLELSTFSPDIMQKLKESNCIPDFISLQNPVDMASFGYLDRIRYLDVIDILQNDDNVDAILPICMSPLGDPYMEIFPFKELENRRKAWKKPVIFAWLTLEGNMEEILKWNKASVPAYPCSARAAQVVVNLFKLFKIRRKLREDKKEKQETTTYPQEIRKLLKEIQSLPDSYIGEFHSKRLLNLMGIETVKTLFASTIEEAIKAASDIGYPLVMKIVDKNIVHKSIHGGVKLNITSDKEVVATFEQFTKLSSPETFQGVTLQPVVPRGIEIIIGAMLDKDAGPVVMVGAGGELVELMGDTTFRLAPVSKSDALEMILELKIFKSTDRSGKVKKHVNTEILADLIVKISHLISTRFVKEIDINPVIFHMGNYKVVDARMVKNPAGIHT